ncbi:MAG: hypothetical protein AB3K77_08935 [Methanosarcinaceae archaeon]
MEIEEHHAAWRRFCRPSVYEEVQSTQEEECVISSFIDTTDSAHPITAFVLNASDEQLEAFGYLNQWMQHYGIRFCNSDSCECEHTEVFHGALRLAGQRLGTD